VGTPDVFSGDSSQTETFISQLLLYFHGKRVEDDFDKVITALSYMKGGTAGPWAKLKVRELTQAESLEVTWEAFVKEFNAKFADPDSAGTARFKIGKLRQGSKTADEFITSFDELQTDTGYNETALIEKFKDGLNEKLVDKIYGLPYMPTTLQGWKDWARKLDRQWRQRETERKNLGLTSAGTSKASNPSSKSFKSPFPSFAAQPKQQPQQSSSQSSQVTQPVTSARTPDVVPMEVDSGWKRFKPLLCWKCKKPGHKAENCQASYNIASMDFDTLKSYMKEVLKQEEANSNQKEDF